MKFTACRILCFAAMMASPVFAQSPASPPQPTIPPTEHPLTKFDLDFPGGTPGQLVAAIQKATGKPLNAIIPTDYADRRLPPLKMSGVDVAQLFEALTEATVQQRFHSGAYEMTQMMFRTKSRPADDSVWFFRVDERALPPKLCRFYALNPYLDQGLTVDDITTAIQTAWKMQGDEEVPTMSFHKETKLLIVAGEQFRLETIERALDALRVPSPKTKPEEKKL